MLSVAQVLAGVVLGFLLLWWLVRWWFRRWLTRLVIQAVAASDCVDRRYIRPARIELVPADLKTPRDDALEQAWADWKALGFCSLGDFEARPLDDTLVRAARLDTPALGLALCAAPEGQEQAGGRFALFALIDGKRLVGVSNDPDDWPLKAGGIDWMIDPEADPSRALAKLAAAISGGAPRTIDSAAQFRTIYERAWAARIDAGLGRPPRRAAFDAHIKTLPQAVPPEIAERAFQLTLTRWNEQVTEAVLDRFRRDGRIEPERWGSIREDVHVVHDHVDDETVIGWLVETDTDRMLADQLVQQGLHGRALYDGMMRRRAPGHQRERLGEVTRPLAAVIVGPASSAPHAGWRPQDHAYVAEDARGETVRGAVVARSSADAKQQLEAMGLHNPRIVLEPMMLGEPAPFMADRSFVEEKARATHRGLGASLLSAFVKNGWLWLPPMLWAGWSVTQGSPFGWGDWISFAVAGIAMLAMVVLVLPMLLFNELCRACLYARWGQARAYLAALRIVNLMPNLNRDQLLAFELKIQAGRGDLDAALTRWSEREPHLPADQYLPVRATLFDAAGDYAGLIATQRALRAVSPSVDMLTVDLAVGLARFGGPAGIDEAEVLLGQVRAQDLSELVAGGHLFGRGLVAAARGQHATASRHFQQAQRQLAQFGQNPLTQGVLSEIGGYHALALRNAGDIRGASAVWASVLPVLRVQPGPHPLLRAWGDVPV